MLSNFKHSWVYTLLMSVLVGPLLGSAIFSLLFLAGGSWQGAVSSIIFGYVIGFVPAFIFGAFYHPRRFAKQQSKKSIGLQWLAWCSGVYIFIALLTALIAWEELGPMLSLAAVIFVCSLIAAAGLMQLDKREPTINVANI